MNHHEQGHTGDAALPDGWLAGNLSGADGRIRWSPVAVWIAIGVFMLLVQVILGGVTRLTGSGLSITEWNVVTGTLPPFTEQAWQAEFDKYKQTPQFRLLNIDFTLSDFKFIFFWEWLHRFWARLIGVVFVVGFIYLTARRHLKSSMVNPLLILFLLGALQGAIGWIMVASGLTGDAIYVKPTRLALHFVFALGLIAYAFWFLLQLLVPSRQIVTAPSVRRLVVWLIVLVVVQLVFGALMAGHRAATAAPTWPSINGYLFPPALFRESPWLLNFIENRITIHFVHRTVAYLVLALAIVLSFRVSRVGKWAGTVESYAGTVNRGGTQPQDTGRKAADSYAGTAAPATALKRTVFPAGSLLRRTGRIFLVLVLLQVALGIFSVLLSPQIIPNHWGAFEWMAQLHQVTGMLLLLSLVMLLYLARRKR